MDFGEEDHKDEVPSSSSYPEYLPPAWFITSDVNLGHLIEAVFVWFVYCKITPPTHTMVWGRESLCIALLGHRESQSTSLREHWSTYVIWIPAQICVFLFIYSVMYIRTHGYIFYTLRYILITAAAAAKSLQSFLTLCDPRDGSPPGSLVPGILQARTLEWVAFSFSNAWKWKVKVKSLSRVRLFATPWTAAYQAPPSMGFPGKSTGVGCHCLLLFWLLPYLFCCLVFLFLFPAL